MKKQISKLAALLLLSSTASVNAQNLSFDQLNALGFPKTITWTSSSYGSGFGHQIYNHDANGGDVSLRFAVRHNSPTFGDLMTLKTDWKVGIGTTNPTTLLDVNGGFTHMTFNSQGTTLPPSDAWGGLTVGWNRLGAGAAEVDFYNVYDNAPKSFVFSQKTGANTTKDLMTISGNGNVSIGAGTAPSAKLHLLEETALPNSQNASQIITRIGGYSGTASSNNLYNNVWLVRSETNSADWWTAKLHDAISLDNGFLTPGTDTKTFWERHPFQDRQTWGSTSTPYMTLDKQRLGIGIYSPDARLDIQEDDNSKSTFIARNVHTVGGGYCVLSNVKQDLTKAFAVANTSAGWSENFVVYGNGATRIGNQTVPSRPNSLLSVSGEIDCKSLFVLKPTTWQDRVFEANYTLQDLEEVEKFIKVNKHLPGLKSEKEILENGYDVNEIDAALLEKIENLFLYVIKLEKELKELKKK